MARKKKVKKTVDEKISEVFDVETSPNPIVKAIPVEGEVIDADIVVAQQQSLALGYATEGENPEIDEDYKSARKILDETGDKAMEALDQMKEVAEQGQSAREYEVVGQLLKINLETAKAKTELHKDMKSLREQEGKVRAQHMHSVRSRATTATSTRITSGGNSGPKTRRVRKAMASVSCNAPPMAKAPPYISSTPQLM